MDLFRSRLWASEWTVPNHHTISQPPQVYIALYHRAQWTNSWHETDKRLLAKNFLLLNCHLTSHKLALCGFMIEAHLDIPFSCNGNNISAAIKPQRTIYCHNENWKMGVKYIFIHKVQLSRAKQVKQPSESHGNFKRFSRTFLNYIIFICTYVWVCVSGLNIRPVLSILAWNAWFLESNGGVVW